MQHRKCDPLGPVDRPDFHNYVLIEILLKKVRLRKCDPLGLIDRPDFHNYILTRGQWTATPALIKVEKT